MSNNYNNQNNKKPGGGKKPQSNQTLIILAITVLVTSGLLLLLSYLGNMLYNKEITYDEFLTYVNEDKVDTVTYSSTRITLTLKDDNMPVKTKYYTGMIYREDTFKLLDEKGVKYKATIEENNFFIEMIKFIVPFILIYLFFSFIFRRAMSEGGGFTGVGKSRAKVYMQNQTGVTFENVAGQEEAKESLKEIVDFLHNPDKYTKIGARLPKGALLIGPPGTGKTLLARAVAGEAKVPFFSISGSDFVEMYVGVGASRVRDLFKQASENSPCIIFIDEIDAIGKSRNSRYNNDEKEQTLNQLLSEMDGFDPSKGIIILGATNRPEVLDKALLRPGRFDRRVIVEKPDLKGRIETLKVHSKNVLMDDTVDLKVIGLATSGLVGADLANIVNEAAINAVKKGRKSVSQNDLMESIEVVVAGKEKKDRIMSEEEKKIVAYHEVGHALVTALKKNADPVQKITIVPRTMGALGYVLPVPEEEKFLEDKEHYLTELVIYMGGRAAEVAK
ncbi:MAG TPA: AAA family ATPase, partial [Eubacterium sp.]|nr:AAA family ATPase [Eubacterium sp.]